jgi:ergothioneine biosynthesis protein EgtB
MLRERLDAARGGTLRLLELVDDDAFAAQPDPDFSPIGWHVGHIATFEAYWLLEQCQGNATLPTEYRQLFSPLETPKSQRRQLPPRPTIMAWLADVRQRVLQYLDTVTLDSNHRLLHDGRIFRTVLQHEYQHSETITLVLQMCDRKPDTQPVPLVPGEAGDTPMVRVPSGSFVMGRDRLDDWYDNEVPAHRVSIDDFLIDITPVTNAQFLSFIAAGGYDSPTWWSADGWTWRCAHAIHAPRYWQRDDAGWCTTGFFGDGVLRPDHPVMCISWYEADAYARWAGKRLPTEAEWEKAAAWDAHTGAARSYAWGEEPPDASRCNSERAFGTTTSVGRFDARSPSGCCDMNGNVWEWTATPFAPFPDFAPYPYDGYSQPYFDGQHLVLRGGSWATSGSIVRNTFRNWYAPATRAVFAGFRCARNA